MPYEAPGIKTDAEDQGWRICLPLQPQLSHPDNNERPRPLGRPGLTRRRDRGIGSGTFVSQRTDCGQQGCAQSWVGAGPADFRITVAMSKPDKAIKFGAELPGMNTQPKDPAGCMATRPRSTERPRKTKNPAQGGASKLRSIPRGGEAGRS